MEKHTKTLTEAITEHDFYTSTYAVHLMLQQIVLKEEARSVLLAWMKYAYGGQLADEDTPEYIMEFYATFDHMLDGEDLNELYFEADKWFETHHTNVAPASE